MTVQRRIILEELRNDCSHPSASEVYERVRLRLPQISLGTVYRNLELLSAHGLILKLDFGPGQRHYDGRADRHSHIRCVECGRVDDAHFDAEHDQIERYMEHASEQSGYEVLGFAMELFGRCPACRERLVHVNPKGR